MASVEMGTDSRVAVLVDCDNTTPEILEYALRVVAQFGHTTKRVRIPSDRMLPSGRPSRNDGIGRTITH